MNEPSTDLIYLGEDGPYRFFRSVPPKSKEERKYHYEHKKEEEVEAIRAAGGPFKFTEELHRSAIRMALLARKIPENIITFPVEKSGKEFSRGKCVIIPIWRHIQRANHGA